MVRWHVVHYHNWHVWNRPRKLIVCQRTENDLQAKTCNVAVYCMHSSPLHAWCLPAKASKSSPTWFQLLQVASTLPMKELDARLTYCRSEKELHDDGKEPFSLFASRPKTWTPCNRFPLLALVISISRDSNMHAHCSFCILDVNYDNAEICLWICSCLAEVAPWVG